MSLMLIVSSILVFKSASMLLLQEGRSAVPVIQINEYLTFDQFCQILQSTNEEMSN